MNAGVYSKDINQTVPHTFFYHASETFLKLWGNFISAVDPKSTRKCGCKTRLIAA